MAPRNYLSIIEENLRRLEELTQNYEAHEERDEYLDEFIQAEADYNRAMALSESSIPQSQREELERRHEITFNRFVGYQFTEVFSMLSGGKKQ